MPATIAPSPTPGPERPVPVPLMLVAGAYTVIGFALVLAGLPVVVAAALTGALAIAHVGFADRMVLRALGARAATPDERETLGPALGQLATAAGIAVPALLVGTGSGTGAGAVAVARARRGAAVVVEPRPPGDGIDGEDATERALAVAVARIARGDAAIETVAAAPGGVGLGRLSRALLAPGAARRDEAAQRAAGRLLETARSGAPACPAVPYRDFVRT